MIWGLPFLTALVFLACEQLAGPVTRAPALGGTVVIDGTPRVGETLRAETDALEGAGSLAYRWQRGDSPDGEFADIPDAAAVSYTLLPADQEKYVRVAVSRAGYSGTKTSPAAGPVEPPEITWTAVADGEAGAVTSTAITFSFSEAVEGLTAADIIVTGRVTAGALSGGGTSWTLALDFVGSAGDLSISINKTGVAGGARNVAVYKQGEIADITWTAEADGEEDTVTSTAITFSFSGAVGGLSAGDITLSAGTGMAGAGALSGGGTSWTLTLDVVAVQGNVTVAINRAGIEAGPRTVAVYMALPPPEPEPEPRVLTGFSIAGLPDIIIYARNQPFESAGLIVEGLYSDGTAEELEQTEYTVSPPNTSTGGLKNVKVSVGEFEPQYFQIIVRNDTKILQSIAVSSPPNKTLYDLGENLDLGGLKINGTYYDSETGTTSTETLGTAPQIGGYSRTKRGVQNLTVTVNGKTAPSGFTVTVRVPASATLTLNHYRNGSSNHQRDQMKPAYIKGKEFDLAGSNLQAAITAGSLKLTLRPADGGITAADIEGFDRNRTGAQTLTLRLDEASETFSVEVLDAEPAVWFDYGYMRHEGDARGEGPGTGKYYARPGETLVLAPVRFLIGYDDDHNDTGVTYNWSVSGASAYTSTTTGGGEYFHVTPAAAGTFTVTVQVSGRSYISGQTISKSASTELVCYTGTVPADKSFGENSSKTPYLRHFAPGQFSEAGSGYGWSLGAAGGYELWRVEHQSSYTITGNPFITWSEPGIVWVQEDKNNNNIPDEMWYELKGGDDDMAAYKDQIRRRYAVTYFNSGGEALTNEYGQLIRKICWADAKGRTGWIEGGWPKDWGVKGNWATYTCTLLRDNGKICDNTYPTLDDSRGYVDACNMDANVSDRTKFFVADAIRADGSSVTLGAVRFIKVQTAVLRYGGIFGEVSTEINSADFLGGQTSFPLP
jgi:hypothetical protein